MVQQKLKAERAKGKQLLGDLQQKDAEYCVLEERYKEAAADVDAFLEGTKKYVPSTTEGHKFTNEIRELYYCLLAENLSPSKIGKSIKIILKAFCPRIDTEKLKLPKKSLALDMRSSKLPTVAKAHEAAALSQMDTSRAV